MLMVGFFFIVSGKISVSKDPINCCMFQLSNSFSFFLKHSILKKIFLVFVNSLFKFVLEAIH